MAKEHKQLTVNTPLKFNSGLIQLVPDGITLTQERQCKNLSLISTKLATSTGSRGATCTLTPKDQYIAHSDLIGLGSIWSSSVDSNSMWIWIKPADWWIGVDLG